MQLFRALLLAFPHIGLCQKVPVDSITFSALTRYAAFASAAYSSDCTVPPYETTAEVYFNNLTTSTQATLFRDDKKKEYILAWRGTSDVQDFITDVEQTLVPCVAPGISCGCTVSTNCSQPFKVMSD